MNPHSMPEHLRRRSDWLVWYPLPFGFWQLSFCFPALFWSAFSWLLLPLGKECIRFPEYWQQKRVISWSVHAFPVTRRNGGSLHHKFGAVEINDGPACLIRDSRCWFAPFIAIRVICQRFDYFVFYLFIHCEYYLSDNDLLLFVINRMEDILPHLGHFHMWYTKTLS